MKPNKHGNSESEAGRLLELKLGTPVGYNPSEKPVVGPAGQVDKHKSFGHYDKHRTVRYHCRCLASGGHSYGSMCSRCTTSCPTPAVVCGRHGDADREGNTVDDSSGRRHILCVVQHTSVPRQRRRTVPRAHDSYESGPYVCIKDCE